MRTTAPTFERINFAEGQRLTANDLQSSVEHERRLAALHTQGLHRTWGIVFGLEVHISGAKTNDQRIEVSTGLAYDCLGRPLVLQETMSIPPPRILATDDKVWHDLVIRYPGKVGGRDISCEASRCMHARSEQPVWRWVRAAAMSSGGPPPLAQGIQLGIDIPLARILVTRHPASVEHASFGFRRHARRMVRPHIAGGHLERGSLPVEGGLFAWSVVIDTSEGGFSRTPHYFVTLAEHPLLMPIEQWAPELIWVLRFLLGPFVFVHEARRDAFRLSVGFAFPTQLSDGVLIPIENCDYDSLKSNDTGVFAFPSREDWDQLKRLNSSGALGKVQAVLPTMNWIGIEPAAGCYEKRPISVLHNGWMNELRNHPEVDS